MRFTTAVGLLATGVAIAIFAIVRPDPTVFGFVKFVVALYIGQFVGVWIYSQILLPILYNFPKSVRQYVNGDLRFAGILWQFGAPASWLLLAVIVGIVAPSFAKLVTTNIGLVTGQAISIIVVLLSLVTPSGLTDLRLDYEETTYARFRKKESDINDEFGLHKT